MPTKPHHYRLTVTWTGNQGRGTEIYTAYTRDYDVIVPGKPIIPGSSEPAFRGNPGRWNPEEMLLASISACHQLWYLHLCATAGLNVQSYRDEAEAVMQEDVDGSGRFVAATLRPHVSFRSGDDLAKAAILHDEAHRACFIANSVNFPVRCEPVHRHA